MMVLNSVFNNSIAVFLPFFTGRKPSKQKRSLGNPLTTNAGINAVGPGKHSISIPASMQAFTKR